MSEPRTGRPGGPEAGGCTVAHGGGHIWQLTDQFSSGMFEVHSFVCSACGRRETKSIDLRPRHRLLPPVDACDCFIGGPRRRYW